MDKYVGSNKYRSTDRLETLVDGIFAIAMTLLVLNLAIPEITSPVSNLAIQNSLYHILPNFISLVVSFVLLALFWSIHHRIFNQIKIVNKHLLWINVIWLLFIVLVPFSASLTGKYGDFSISHIIFNLNMLGISFFLYLNWAYANQSDLLHENVDVKTIPKTKMINLVFIFITLLALLLSFVIPSFSSLVYLLIFPLEYLIEG
jgi:uncharacterized membrane protein